MHIYYTIYIHTYSYTLALRFALLYSKPLPYLVFGPFYVNNISLQFFEKKRLTFEVVLERI